VADKSAIILAYVGGLLISLEIVRDMGNLASLIGLPLVSAVWQPLNRQARLLEKSRSRSSHSKAKVNVAGPVTIQAHRGLLPRYLLSVLILLPFSPILLGLVGISLAAWQLKAFDDLLSRLLWRLLKRLQPVYLFWARQYWQKTHPDAPISDRQILDATRPRIPLVGMVGVGLLSYSFARQLTA